MAKRRHLLNNNEGISVILEAVVAVGISITLLFGYFYSANNLFVAQKDPGTDLESKSVGLMETLISSTGQNIHSDPDWSGDPGDGDLLKSLGLGTSLPVQWGVCKVNADKTMQIVSGPFPQSSIGEYKTCFLAGTKIVMADGSVKSIEEIVVGDKVKSYDEENKVVVEKSVSAVFHHDPDEMGEYYLVINNQVRVTPNHQFYINGKWIYADELKLGDSLFYPSSDYRVFSIEKISEKVETYNFEVEDNHNYFISVDDTYSLVHNGPAPPNVEWLTGFPNPVSGTAPLTVHFAITVQGNGGPYNVGWSYGEGMATIENGAYGTLFYSNNTYQHPPPTGDHFEVSVFVSTSSGYDYVTKEIHVYSAGYQKPVADFTWFDADGPYDPTGTTVCFNAGCSIVNLTSPVEYKWTVNATIPFTATFINNPIYNCGTNFSNKINVTLKIIDYLGNYSAITKEIQANVPYDPEPESRPWVLTGKEINPENTQNSFISYSANYYVNYTKLSAGSSYPIYYMFQVKEKDTQSQPILDYKKIEKLCSGDFDGKYNEIKNALGLDSSDGFYNFRIEIEINGDSNDYFYGASYQNASNIKSTKKEVLVYYRPETIADGSSFKISKHPYCKQAQISLYVFLGGEAP